MLSLAFYLVTVGLATAAVLGRVSQRVLPLVDIDEAGYIQFARSHYLALQFNGIPGYLDSVLHQAVFAPLVPAVGALAQFFAGGEPMSALMVNSAFFAVTAIVAFLIGLQLGGHYVGWASGLISMGSLALIDYAVTFQFAEAVAAFSALAFFFALRSRTFESITYSALMGAAIGLMALSRTMTVAFVPAFFVAGFLWLLLTPGRRRRRILNLCLGFGVMLVVAAPWYIVNAAGIANYLFKFGYGTQSKEYGTSGGGVLNPAAWQKVAQGLAESTAGPLVSIAVLLGLALLFVKLALGFQKRATVPRWLNIRVPLSMTFVAATTLLFVVALVSSQNSSLSFFTALIVPIAALAAFGLVSGPRPFWKRVIMLCLVLIFCLNTSVKSQLWPGVVWPQIPVPFGAQEPLSSARTNFDSYISGALHSVPIVDGVAAGVPWQDSISSLRTLIEKESPVTEVAFGFRHKLVNANSVELDYSLKNNANFPTRMIDPQVLDTSDSGLSRWLLNDSGVPPCILLTASGTSGEFEPYVDQTALARAAGQDGYRLIEQVPLGTDRVIMAWQNATHCGKD